MSDGGACCCLLTPSRLSSFTFSGAITGQIRQHDQISQSPFGVVTVPDHFVYMQFSAAMLTRVENFTAPDGFKGEALVVYEKANDKGGFWDHNPEYCSVCFGKTQTEENPLLACATAAACLHRCHRSCRPSHPALLCGCQAPQHS